MIVDISTNNDIYCNQSNLINIILGTFFLMKAYLVQLCYVSISQKLERYLNSQLSIALINFVIQYNYVY